MRDLERETARARWYRSGLRFNARINARAYRAGGGVSEVLVVVGAPGRSRTCDPRIRSPMLYPTELQARQLVTIHREQLRTPVSNAPPRSSARTAPRAGVVHFARTPVSRLSAPTRRRRVKDLSAYRGRTRSSAVLSAASGRRMGWRVCSLRSLNSTR